jgi:FkbM family methyltransferase
MRFLKNVVQEALKSRGYYIAHIPGTGPHTPDPLVYHEVGLLLDVGANTGQYAMEARAKGYSKRIVSFEPLPDAYVKLLDNSRRDKNWIAHDRCALSDKQGCARINISQNSWSSSLLPMTKTHATAAPESFYIGQAETPTITLDSVFDQYHKIGERTFLKIDTQGFERNVLQGALHSLPSIFGLQLELSVQPLYEGQELFLPLMNMVANSGFKLWQIIPGLANTNGQLLQFDAIFIH